MSDESLCVGCLVEPLADMCHRQWVHWMTYLFKQGDFNEDGSFTVNAESMNRWLRQVASDYKSLSGKEQDSDREQAKKYIELLREQGLVRLECKIKEGRCEQL